MALHGGRSPSDRNLRARKSVHEICVQDNTEAVNSYSVKPKDFYGFWRSLVTAYSTMAITNPQDKLPAILGLANELRSVFGDDYLAGLWKNDLHNNLLLTCEAPRALSTKTRYRAPSWSWASVEGAISYPRDQGSKKYGEPPDQPRVGNSCIQILDGFTIPDATGHLITGHIRIRGMVMKYPESSKSKELITYFDDQFMKERANSENLFLLPTWSCNDLYDQNRLSRGRVLNNSIDRDCNLLRDSRPGASHFVRLIENRYKAT